VVGLCGRWRHHLDRRPEFSARNNLRRMAKGNAVLFYHSGDLPSPRSRADTTRQVTRSIVISRESSRLPVPTRSRTKEIGALSTCRRSQPRHRRVTLAEIKSKPQLRNIELVRQSRLSVMLLGEKEFQEILKMGGL
jgi:predicted RNA-binding protein with PUA-like domain